LREERESSFRNDFLKTNALYDSREFECHWKRGDYTVCRSFPPTTTQ